MSEHESGNSPSEQFTEAPEDDVVEKIEKDREERLDPDNRPENTEIDNSERTFDAEKAMYTDEDGYDRAEVRFPASEQGA